MLPPDYFDRIKKKKQEDKQQKKVKYSNPLVAKIASEKKNATYSYDELLARYKADPDKNEMVDALQDAGWQQRSYRFGDEHFMWRIPHESYPFWRSTRVAYTAFLRYKDEAASENITLDNLYKKKALKIIEE